MKPGKYLQYERNAATMRHMLSFVDRQTSVLITARLLIGIVGMKQL